VGTDIRIGRVTHAAVENEPTSKAAREPHGEFHVVEPKEHLGDRQALLDDRVSSNEQ
jgi:hypothetical protein